MASFTDIQPQFTPYIQQLPVEAMVQVGMEKQRRYDEGVQKIQTNINNIAGLDIANDAQREYLQSKINDLGNNLKTVAAGDFSNFQLVNSVSGMASQIAKDPTIKSAVQSTQLIRKGQQAKEQAKKAGKSSINNEDYWDSQVGDFLNNKDVNATFNGEYFDYIDLNKKLRDVAKEVVQVDKTVQIPYKRDNDGNPVLIDGKPVVDEVLLAITTKGKPAEKILANFYSSLNANDQKQLSIDAWAHYRGADANKFKADITKNYNSEKKLLSEELVNLNVEITTSSELTAAEKSQKQARAKDISTILSDGSLERNMEKQILDVDSSKNIEDYKYKLYTQTYLTQLAKDTSYESYSQEIKTNPAFQASMVIKNYNLAYDQAVQSQLNWEKTHSLNQATLFLEQEKRGGSSPVTAPGRIATDVDKPSLTSLRKEVNGLTDEVNSLNNKYAGQLSNPTLKTPEEKVAYLNGIFDKYNRDPSTIDGRDNVLRKYLEDRRALEIVKAQKNQLYAKTELESKKFDQEIDKALTGVAGVSDTNGRQLFSAKDFYTFGAESKQFYETVGAPGGSVIGAPGSTTKLNTKELVKKYAGTKFAPLANAMAKNYLGQELTPTEKVLMNRNKDIYQKYSPVIGKINAEKSQFQSDYLAERMPERQTAIGTLDVQNNKADETAVSGLIGNKLVEFSKGGVDVDKSSDFDPDTLAKIRKDPKASYTIEKKFDGSANLIITSGSTQQIVPMNAAEFSSNFPKYSRKNPINDIKAAIIGSPNKTTNLVGGSDGSTAINSYLTGYSLPGISETKLAPLVRVDVEGSPDNDGSANDEFQVRMYVFDNGIWKTGILNEKGYVNEAGVREILSNGIGPNTVNDFLKKNK